MTSRFLIALTVLTFASPVSAQRFPDRARLDWVTGFLMQGDLAGASFTADFSQFQGQVVSRDQGSLSIDPSPWYGVRGSYRFTENLSVSASWMHSRGRFQVRFPAEASIEGDFDLEGLLLATLDFQTGTVDQGGTQAESAMSDALSDAYLATATYELPTLNRWFFPYLMLGGGIFKQKSDGNVIQFRFTGPLPPGEEQAQGIGGQSTESVLGLSIFQVNQTNPIVSVGGGFRVSLAQKWGVDVSIEDLIRFGVDMSYLNGTLDQCPNDPGCGPGTLPKEEGDPSVFPLFSTMWNGESSAVIHNFGFRIALTYSVWPYGRPR